jgi:hypothetical protein
MIYWHDQQKIWTYLLDCDAKIITQEMEILIKQTKTGKIVRVTKGLVVDVKGTLLYPVEFEFKDVQCPAYFLVAKKGLIDHLHMTTYFFRSENKCDELFEYINKHSQV